MSKASIRGVQPVGDILNMYHVFRVRRMSVFKRLMENAHPAALVGRRIIPLGSASAGVFQGPLYITKAVITKVILGRPISRWEILAEIGGAGRANPEELCGS